MIFWPYQTIFPPKGTPLGNVGSRYLGLLGMTDFQQKLNLQSYLLKDWAGTPLDDACFLRILNPNGFQPPLIWCFNAKHEFPMLADALGPDQPLIGMRSMHLVARMEPGRALMDAAMGDHYANLLAAHLPEGPCFVGGNCQGVPVALRVALRVELAWRRCLSFIAMEWEPCLPLPLPTTLLFGAESTMFNPYLRGDPDAAARWTLLFAKARCQIVPGGHGAYFTEQNITALASAIRRGMSVGPKDATPDIPPLRITTSATEADTGAPLPLHLDLGAGQLPEGLSLAHIWRDAATGEVMPVVGQQLAVQGPHQVNVAAPARPGQWDLIVFPTLPPLGPVQWQDHLEPVARISVTCRDRAA